MSTMNVSLPEALRAFVDRKVRSGAYGTSSEYVRELIREDRARDALRRALVAGLESGRVGRADTAYWSRKRRRLTR